MNSASYGQSTPTGISLQDFRCPDSFSSYDHSARRRSPSPGLLPRRHLYDSYKPRGGSSYREDHLNNHWPNVWRPERYRSRSPSPPRYERSRTQDFRHWDSNSRWQPTYHHHRRSPPSPPPRDKGRRDTMAERMFEPSDTWKQSHVDRPARYELPDSAADRYGDRRPPIPRDFSPRRGSTRSGFTHYSGDSYRPYSGSLRDTGLVARADTYRPHYPDDSWRSYTSDAAYQPRMGTYYGREDDRPLSSIASTPPLRQSVRSPSPRTYTRADSSYRGALARSPILYDNQRLYTPSPSRSRRSSVSEEPPRKKFKSRSSSRTSRDSGLEKSAMSEFNDVSTLPQLPIKSSNAMVETKSSTHVANDVPSLSSDQKVPLECASNTGVVPGFSIGTQSRSHETAHVNGDLVAGTKGLDFGSPRPEASELTPILDDALSKGTPENAADHCTEKAVMVLDSSEAGQSQEPLPSSNLTLVSEPVHNVEYAPTNNSFSPNGVGDEWSPSSSTVTPSAVSRSLEKEVEVVPSPTCHQVNIDGQTVKIIAPEPIANSLQIVISDHSTFPGSDHPEHNSTHQPSESTDLKAIRDGLRLVVLTRIRCDRQTRAERVFPVVRANQIISGVHSLLCHSESQSHLFQEATSGSQFRDIIDSQAATRTSLVDRFVKRQSEILEKTKKLKEEYLVLHERWLEHCARLDEGQRNGNLEETTIPAGGRATRRSTAILGDAVRSDLEMEQIIASLGVEELTDPSYLAVKNVAKIPDMISVTHGSVPLLFDDTNNLVDDPAEFYGASSGHDYWTEEERSIFLTEFAAHPKQFGLIAERLPNKSVAQCVTYYYLHKKQAVDFRKAVMQYGSGRRRKNGKGANKRKGNALLADIRRHDDEVSRELSGGVLVATGGSTTGKRKREIHRGELRKSSTPRRGTVRLEATPTSSGTTPDPEADQQKRKRRAATVLSTCTVAPGTTDDTVGDVVVPDLEGKSVKKGRRARKSKGQTATPQSDEPATRAPAVGASPHEQLESIIQHKSSSSLKAWSEDDKSCFISLFAQYGDDFKRIAASMPNKTSVQVSNYYRNNVRELDLERVTTLAPKRSPTPIRNREPNFRSGGIPPPGPIDTSSFHFAHTPTDVVELSDVTEPLSSRRLQISDLLSAPSGPGFYQSSGRAVNIVPLSYIQGQQPPLWSRPSQTEPSKASTRPSADTLFPVLGDCNFTSVSQGHPLSPRPYPVGWKYSHFATS